MIRRTMSIPSAPPASAIFQLPRLYSAGSCCIDAGVHIRRIADDRRRSGAARAAHKDRLRRARCGRRACSRPRCAATWRRGRGQVHRVDVGIRKRVRRENREAPGTRAQFEHGAYLLGIFHIRLQAVLQQLADKRTRHDHALVDGDARAVHPRFLRDGRGRHALLARRSITLSTASISAAESARP